jgi:adenylate cyclase
MLGITCFGTGDLEPAREHLEEARRLHDPNLAPLVASSFGDDPRVVCLSHTAMVEWFLGRPDRSLACSDEALAVAHEVGVPHSLVFALNYAVWCRLLRREGPAARAHADALVALATEHGLSYWVAQGAAVRGWALIDVGDVADGIAEIRRGLELYETIGAEVMRPWHLVRLAEAYAALGRLDEARAAVAESRATMERRDERFYEAELCRIEGEIGRRSGDQAAAEERFRTALATSRRQGARSLELRAALSLARLVRDADARASLERVAARFDEGRDTGDLRAARALIAELPRT